MKTIYVKCGRDRSARRQIETRIEEKDGRLQVVKRPLTAAARQHVLDIYHNFQQLEPIYQPPFAINRGEMQGEELVLEYLEGENLKSLFLQQAKKGMAQLKPLLAKYVFYVRQNEEDLIPFEPTPEFAAIFGEQNLPKDTPAFRVCNFDSIPANVVITKDGTWNAIDYEYVYLFPIPVDLVLYRNLSDLYENNRPCFANCCTEKELLDAAGICLPHDQLQKMCNSFYDAIQQATDAAEAMPKLRRSYSKEVTAANELSGLVETKKEQNLRMSEMEARLEMLQEENNAQKEEMQKQFSDHQILVYELEEKIRQLEGTEAGLNGQIAYLQSRSNVLDSVYASRTWRYSHKLATLGRKVCPVGTFRARVLGVMLRAPLRLEHWLRALPGKIRQKNAQRHYFERLAPLLLPNSEKPLVSIVIPVYNQFQFTYNCLQTIVNECAGMAYEVILADDNSSDDTRRIQEKVSGLVVVRNAQNQRFLLNCNNAAKKAQGKYILFLNNDTEVQEGWLQALCETIETDETIGMVGSKLIYSNGQLQEAGGILWKDGSAWNYGHGDDPEKSEYNYVKEVDYISGCSIMIRRSLWEEIGGFDERFVPAYCEDSDLAFEVRAHGYRVVYQPKSVVIHHEGVSNGTDTSCGQKRYQVINAKKFYEKWKKVLEKEHFDNAVNVFCARDRSREKPCLLVIDHYTPTYDQDAGSRTVYEYLRLFVKMGYNVKFIPDNFYRMPKYSEALEQMGVEVLYGPEYAQHWQEWVIAHQDAIRFVFTNRPHISIKYIDFLRKNTRAKIAYYGHDLHSLRELREYELTGDEEKLASSEKWKAIEYSLMRKADVAYYPSKIEQDVILENDPAINVKVLVPYIFTEVCTPSYRLDERRDVMFLGGFNHGPNVDAALWFAKEVFPLVEKELPDLHWHILGSHPPEQVEALASAQITVHGFVTDEQLAAFYASCRMSIVPLRYGAGIKGKVIEAMKFGIPVLTTSVGAEGILGAETALAVEDDPAGFAARLVALYRDEKTLSAMSAASCAYIRTEYGIENAMKLIRDDFT